MYLPIHWSLLFMVARGSRFMTEGVLLRRNVPSIIGVIGTILID